MIAARVPEHLRDDLRVHPLSQKQGRAGVPEVVEAYVGQPGTPQEWLEVAGHEVRVVRVSAKGATPEQLVQVRFRRVPKSAEGALRVAAQKP